MRSLSFDDHHSPLLQFTSVLFVGLGEHGQGKILRFAHQSKASPGLCILFEEALRNLPKTTYFEKAKSKINVLNENSEKFLNELDIYDVIYVDPMFDIKSKAGRSGQLNTMQKYLSDQSDVSITLIGGNFKRMVIKRPISFNQSKSLKPQITVKGKAVVFHVFLKNPNN